MNQEVTIGLIGRILARYISGALVAKGLIDVQTAGSIDAEFVALVTGLVGVGIGLATEWLYALARRLGWAK